MWGEIRYYVIAAGVALTLCGLSSAYFYSSGRHDGSADCEAAHTKAQLEQNLKEGKSDAKRDRAKPVNVDRAAKLKWLYENARKQ